MLGPPRLRLDCSLESCYKGTCFVPHGYDAIRIHCASQRIFVDFAGHQNAWHRLRRAYLVFPVCGWTLSEDEEKDKPFSEVFHALGVDFNLKGVNSG